MRPFLRYALTLSLLALPASAGEGPDPMGAAEFDAYVTGHTITYNQFGQPYGIEEYLPGRKVRWAFTADECQYGTWYEDQGQICFVYEYDPTPQCWAFWLEDGTLRALFEGNQPGEELVEVEKSSKALNCPGPDVGV